MVGVDALASLASLASLTSVAAAGFDLAHAFDAAAAARAPGMDWLAGPERRGILIGNTRALWPPFTEAMRDPSLAAERDPLERYTERTIDAAFGAAAAAGAARIYYSHRRYAGQFLPMQRLAAALGLGALAPSHLVIHPIYGPWFALRAVVVIGGDGDGEPPPRAPIAQPCQCSAACEQQLARALQSTDWRDWLAVRDACTLRAWRYSDDQIAYHYAGLRLAPPE